MRLCRQFTEVADQFYDEMWCAVLLSSRRRTLSSQSRIVVSCWVVVSSGCHAQVPHDHAYRDCAEDPAHHRVDQSHRRVREQARPLARRAEPGAPIVRRAVGVDERAMDMCCGQMVEAYCSANELDPPCALKKFNEVRSQKLEQFRQKRFNSITLDPEKPADGGFADELAEENAKMVAVAGHLVAAGSEQRAPLGPPPWPGTMVM